MNETQAPREMNEEEEQRWHDAYFLALDNGTTQEEEWHNLYFAQF